MVLPHVPQVEGLPGTHFNPVTYPLQLTREQLADGNRGDDIQQPLDYADLRGILGFRLVTDGWHSVVLILIVVASFLIRACFLGPSVEM